MQIENTEIYGIQAFLRALRNPMNSWNKSDSTKNQLFGPQSQENIYIGPNDLDLAIKLIKAGTEHRKCLRMIQVWVDLTLPRYIWTELDTYKVATVRVSCSTMHKLGSRDLIKEDFQDNNIEETYLTFLNNLGKLYRETKELKYLRQMKQALPEGFLQKATYNCNYETLMNIYRQRKSHRMTEWHEFCGWIETLPYMKDFLKE